MWQRLNTTREYLHNTYISVVGSKQQFLAKNFDSPIWDRCYDFKKIFLPKKTSEKIRVFDSKQSRIMQKF
jgi:hypothetical protein